MSNTAKIYTYPSLWKLGLRLRDDFRNDTDFTLIFAFNGVGKTRLSMEFRNIGKKKDKVNKRDTLYFNAFTEDLFTWDNDLENETERVLKINRDSHFFDGLIELEMDNRIRPLLQRYADFDFRIDSEKWEVVFSRKVTTRKGDKDETITIDNIKVSRGEENLFIWCFFLAIVQLALDNATAYDWVKYVYIDDPITERYETVVNLQLFPRMA
jgi:hypothetical protein